ncbi:hypothetical protein D4A92_23080 (plasmid) [Rhizobium rosettiformans]|uniref:Uncharacterized protein n=1 Tax=Rhizobium rosettiformans TaxID=1368430 RepID=A0ABX7F1S6_9HYPH|nr:hypothetical protein D4A92_23080 [Rhizobium rosettiformans]
MQHDSAKILELHVAIALGCLRRTTIRSYAGRGPSRRRDLHLIPSMAEAVAHHVTSSLHFEKDGAAVILSRITRHIEAVLQSVSDAEARAWAGIDANQRDLARSVIGNRISLRLQERYAVLSNRRSAIVPASGVWCGLPSAESD